MTSLKNTARLLLSALVVSACLIIPAVAATSALEEFDNPNNDYIKIYLITKQDGQGIVMEKPERRVFWEYPLLSAGQTRTGTLYIKNETQNRLDFETDDIDAASRVRDHNPLPRSPYHQDSGKVKVSNSFKAARRNSSQTLALG